MRCGCVLILVTLYLLIFGAQTVRDGLAFRCLKVVDCDTFIQHPPKEGWYEVKGCVLNLTEASYEVQTKRDSDGKGDITEAYVPAYSISQWKRRLAGPADAPNKEQIGLVLVTRDHHTLYLLESLRALDGKGEKANDAFLDKHLDELIAKRDLHGMVQAGVNASESTRADVARLSANTRPGFALLNDGAEPDLGRGFLMVSGGFVLGVGTVWWLTSMFRSKRLRL